MVVSIRSWYRLLILHRPQSFFFCCLRMTIIKIIRLLLLRLSLEYLALTLICLILIVKHRLLIFDMLGFKIISIVIQIKCYVSAHNFSKINVVLYSKLLQLFLLFFMSQTRYLVHNFLSCRRFLFSTLQLWRNIALLQVFLGSASHLFDFIITVRIWMLRIFMTGLHLIRLFHSL